MRTNFHTHTLRCRHASGSEEDYIKEALDKGLDILGFSDHAPFPDIDFGMRMPFSELVEYSDELDRLRLLYKDRLKIYKGLEIEYHECHLLYYHELFDNYGMDFLALGEHIFRSPEGEYLNIFNATSTKDYLLYADEVCRAIETGLFAYIAHPDVMFINSLDWDERCEEACRRIVECSKKHDAVLELNANGIRRGKRLYSDGLRYPYPHEYFWRLVRDRGIRVIVGSDCHIPEQVYDDAMKYGIELADSFGLNRIENFFNT